LKLSEEVDSCAELFPDAGQAFSCRFFKAVQRNPGIFISDINAIAKQRNSLSGKTFDNSKDRLRASGVFR
jgi:hypothetical protein